MRVADRAPKTTPEVRGRTEAVAGEAGHLAPRPLEEADPYPGRGGCSRRREAQDRALVRLVQILASSSCPGRAPELPQVPPCRHGRGRYMRVVPGSGMAARRRFPCAPGISKEVRGFNTHAAEAPLPPETWTVIFSYGRDSEDRAVFGPTDGVPTFSRAERPAEVLLVAHGRLEVDAWPPYPRVDHLLEATPRDPLGGLRRVYFCYLKDIWLQPVLCLQTGLIETPHFQFTHCVGYGLYHEPCRFVSARPAAHKKIEGICG